MTADPFSDVPNGGGTPLSEADIEAMSRWARWMRLTIGLVCVAAGAFALFAPDRTLKFIGFLIGAQLVVIGLVRLWALRTFVFPRNIKVFGDVLAVLTIVAGIFCMVRPGASLLVVAIFIGVGWIADGILQLIAFATGSTTERGWALLSGLLTVLGGVAVLVFPDKTLVLLAQVTGVILLVFGVSYLLSGVARGRARSLQG